MSGGWARARGAVLAALLAVGCVGSSGEVVRVVDGRELPGRYVSHHAYAAYARGAQLEASGDLRGAQNAYHQALEADPPSVEIWTRIGSLRCQLAGADPEQAFARAAEIDESYAPLHRERGRCKLRRGQPAAAVEDLRRAFALDPDHEETSLLIASAYQKQRRLDEAERWLEGLVARDPTSLPGWSALHALATERRDERRRARAASMLERYGATPGGELAQELALIARLELDRAVRAGDLKRARQLAVEQRLSPAELALRAAALGGGQLALEQARWVLGADPANADAWIAALVAADLVQDRVAFDQALRALGTHPMEPTPLGALLLGELLDRRVGPEAMHAWRSTLGPLPAPRDALERAVQERSERPPLVTGK